MFQPASTTVPSVRSSDQTRKVTPNFYVFPTRLHHTAFFLLVVDNLNFPRDESAGTFVYFSHSYTRTPLSFSRRTFPILPTYTLQRFILLFIYHVRPHSTSSPFSLIFTYHLLTGCLFRTLFSLCFTVGGNRERCFLLTCSKTFTSF